MSLEQCIENDSRSVSRLIISIINLEIYVKYFRKIKTLEVPEVP